MKVTPAFILNRCYDMLTDDETECDRTPGIFVGAVLTDNLDKPARIITQMFVGAGFTDNL